MLAYNSSYCLAMLECITYIGDKMNLIIYVCLKWNQYIISTLSTYWYKIPVASLLAGIWWHTTWMKNVWSSVKSVLINCVIKLFSPREILCYILYNKYPNCQPKKAMNNYMMCRKTHPQQLQSIFFRLSKKFKEDAAAERMQFVVI